MSLESFPFGIPIEPLVQTDRRPKRVFVLGVYASAVHARWVAESGQTTISALGVASEPEIFWRGEGAAQIISGVPVPEGAGSLKAAGPHLNGPSGRALDELFLSPLGVHREEAWLCDLLPLSRKNKGQAAALARAYDPHRSELGLPAYHWPPVPLVLADAERRTEIEQEVGEASSEIIITLGDQPLKWFTRHSGSNSRLSAYGETLGEYGRLHPLQIAGRRLSLLPLVHPRQGAGLGTHSSKWADLHSDWVKHVAGTLIAASG